MCSSLVEKPDLLCLNSVEPLHFDLKPRTTLGFVQLPSDLTLDMEAPFLLSQIPGVMWRNQKMKFEKDDELITSGTFERAKKNIKFAAGAFLPVSGESFGSLDVVALTCTSLSFTLGTADTQAELLEGYPNVVAVDMASSILNSLNSVCNNNLIEHKIGVLTPYINELHNNNINFLKRNGVFVLNHLNLNIPVDFLVSQLSPDSIFMKACELYQKNSSISVLIICCSALRSTQYGFIDRLEKKLNIPVITSNQAMMWECLQKSKNIGKDEIKGVIGYGRLFYEYDYIPILQN